MVSNSARVDLKCLISTLESLLMDFDLHDSPYNSCHGKHRNTKENYRKVPSRREAIIKFEILQNTMIQAQGKQNHEKREPSPDVRRKIKCRVECR